MSGMLAEVHGSVAPMPTPPGATPDPAFHPGDQALLALHATVDGEGNVAWPSRDELQQALQGHAAVLDEGTDLPPGTPSVPGLDAATARELGRQWKVQLLLPPGDQQLGPLKLALKGADGAVLDQADVPAIPVTLATVLDEATAKQLDAAGEDAAAVKEQALQALAPPRGPWELQGPGYGAWIAAGAAALALALLAWWLLARRKRPRAAVPAPPPEPAEIVARRRLAALRAAGLLERGEHRAFHVEIADILKTYLDARHGWDLVDRTTDEVRRFLTAEQRKRPRLGEIRADVLETLAACDLVKFAKHAPDRAEALGLIDAVGRVVETTTIVAATPTPDSKAGAA